MERVSNSSLLGSLLSLSSALIRNVKNIDFNFSNDLQASVAASRSGTALDDNPVITQPPPTTIPTPPPASGAQRLPGPYAFLTSSYALGIVATAFILNRVQHIVVAPRRQPHRTRPRRQAGVRSYWQRAQALLVPLDPSSTASRLALNLPAIYLLLKALLLLTCILLQVSDAFPSGSWAAPLGAWAAGQEMSRVCWSVYAAVCVGLCCGALTQGLLDDGDGGNAMPFNLAGYAFLLHIYSSPIAHAVEPISPGLPSRPSGDVLITILLPALQLTLLQFMMLKKQWSNKRLVPTTICGLFSLAHFYAVVWSSPLTYPPLNFIPCVLTTLLIFVSLTTCILNALTQILSQGTISQPLFGHNQALPRWEDDFEIALLRLGTASLQATHIAGLSNQVAALNTGPDAAGEVELSASGIAGMAHTSGARGFAREYKKVTAQRPHSGDLFGGTGMLWREARRFGNSLWVTLRGVWRMMANSKTSQVAAAPASTPPPAHAGASPGEDDSDELYARFLRGDPLGDDSEGEFQPGADMSLDSSSDEDDDREEDDADAVDLYADLATNQSNASSQLEPQLLMAHMASPSSAALTRRRYSRLLRQGSPGEEDWDDYIEQRRRAKLAARPPRGEADSRSECVICTVEARCIVCWPCRCLAMCDDCRANLASRSSASQHMCPCCRRTVEGFSRIYIP